VPAGEPLSMTLTFHEDVVVESSAFTLQRIGGGEYELAVTYDAGTMTVTVASQTPLAGGHYELTVSDSIVDVNGLALDGELTAPMKSAALPSGDGSPGGDAVIAFAAIGTRGPARRISATD